MRNNTPANTEKSKVDVTQEIIEIAKEKNCYALMAPITYYYHCYMPKNRQK